MEVQHSRSILIVEDDQGMLRILADSIRRLGIEVKTASNGKEGLELTQKHKFNAILTDLNMPVMSGIGMLNEIRKQAINTPCVVLTGEGESELILQSLRLGVVDYIEKPSEMAKIKETVLRALEIGFRKNKINEEIMKRDPDLAKKIANEERMIWLMRVFNNDENKSANVA